MLNKYKWLLAIILVVGVFVGCVGGGSSEAPAAVGAMVDADEDGRRYIDGAWFPIVDNPITITWFYELDGKSAVTMTSYSQIRAYQYVMELTNINIDFHHPPAGQATEAFNLMMASGDLTDIITRNFRTGFTGGATRALVEGLILPLNDLMESYAPNIWGFYQANPELARLAKTDEGIFYGFHDGSIEQFPSSVDPPPAFFTFGWQIRQDWLDEVGLPLPRTVEDWEYTLRAFKALDPVGDGTEIFPLVHVGNNVSHWLRAWGYNFDTFTVVDGEVRFGPFQPEYLEFLTTLNRWYEDGLLEPDYVTFDANQFDNRVLNDRAGAWTGATGGTLGRLVQLFGARESDARLTGTIHPYVAGSRAFNFDGASRFTVEGLAHVVSANTNYPVEIVRLLDFGYGEYGHRLYNWGFEGESFYIDANGDLHLTEYITNNPNGLALDDALMPFAPGGNNGPMFKSATLWNRRMWMPEQREAVANWSYASQERILPPIAFTPEESGQVASIMSRVNTHRDEMLHRFIMGVTPLSEFDAYIANLESMGILEAIEIHQAAYERFQLR